MVVDDRAYVARILAVQAEGCRALGSTLYHHLLSMAAEDALAGGPVWDVMSGSANPRRRDATGLRLMAAVHRLVLLREAPRLACFYPSVGGTADLDEAWPAFRALLAERGDEVRKLAALPCQTNEVGRAGLLLPGFLRVARETGLPLRLLEIGSSAGLQLRWDAFFFDMGYGTWGEPSSPVQLYGAWEGPPVDLDVAVEIVERRGCDPRPVDPTTPEGRLTLTASVWADQVGRFESLRGALELAGRIPARVDTARAGDWLPQRLAEAAPGVATVVFHTIVLQYLAPAELLTVRETLSEAGARATPEAPLAWLFFEPEDPETMSLDMPYVVELQTWPGGTRRRLAVASPHGASIRWLA